LAGAEQTEHADGIDCGGRGQGQLRGFLQKSTARQPYSAHFFTLPLLQLDGNFIIFLCSLELFK
jgi:hypothetical protein